jgi:uncharacterized protein (DUF433 family)
MMTGQGTTRSLRIGMVQNGLVTEERIIPLGSPATIGDDESCTFRTSAVMAPSFPLFDLLHGVYHLNWRAEFAGRITVGEDASGPLQPGSWELAELRDRALVRADGSFAIEVHREYKGKIRVGEVIFLFHFMPEVEDRERLVSATTVEPPPQAAWHSAVAFQSDLQRQVYERARGYLEDRYGRFGSHPTQPYFALDRGSARAVIRVDPWQHDAVVRVIAWVITGADLSDPGLMRFLLEKNHSTTFGAFGLDPEGDIFFAHTIVGSTCDREELIASVETVLEMADYYDDEIQQRWGGMRALDAVVADEPTVEGEVGVVRKFSRIQLAANGGDNCIRGLPIPVSAVLEMIAAGRSDDEIRAVFPEIECEDIDQVRSFGDFVDAQADAMLGS